MNKSQQEYLKLSKQDPLSIAESITGFSYKESEATSLLGFALAMDLNEQKRQILAEIGDTQFSNTLVDYLAITNRFGFEVVLKDEFEIEERKEWFYILFHKEFGIIISFDTFSAYYDEPHVNGGNIYYNWSPNSIDLRGECTSSGGFYFPKNCDHIGMYEPDMLRQYIIPDYPKDIKWGSGTSWEEFKRISEPLEQKQRQLINEATANGKRILWSGSHDCREGVITNIKRLYENGKFFPIWHNPPFLWLVHYGETKKDAYDYKAITQSRIARLPQFVRDCIQPNSEQNVQVSDTTDAK